MSEKIKHNTEAALLAPEGQIWVCLCCGKTSDHRYGSTGWCHPGWDESCLLNCALLLKDGLIYNNDKRVIGTKHEQEDIDVSNSDNTE